jgi:predicted DNA-binding protein
MALELKDVRAKLDPEMHEELSALAAAKGREMGELLREAVQLYLADENRKAHEYKIFLRMKSVQGVDGESSGTSTT